MVVSDEAGRLLRVSTPNAEAIYDYFLDSRSSASPLATGRFPLYTYRDDGWLPGQPDDGGDGFAETNGSATHQAMIRCGRLPPGAHSVGRELGRAGSGIASRGNDT